MNTEDHATILDLISRYSYSYDTQDWELFASIWAGHHPSPWATLAALSRPSLSPRHTSQTTPADPSPRLAHRGRPVQVLWNVPQISEPASALSGAP